MKIRAEEESCVIAVISYTYKHLLTFPCWF